MDLFASLYLEGICKDKRLNADLKLKSSCIHNQWNKKAEGNEFVTKTRCLLTDELTSISRATFQKEKNQFTFKAQNSKQRYPKPNFQHGFAVLGHLGSKARTVTDMDGTLHTDL